MESLSDKVFEYVKDKYGASPVHLWRRYPEYAIFRHEDNEKWFGFVMDVPAGKLATFNKSDEQNDSRIDILNVKLKNPVLREILIQQPGYSRAYHIARGNWISVRLDGTVPLDEICRWLDESFLTTASKEVKQKFRAPKEWIIPANPKYFDIIHAFDKVDEINWKQGAGIRAGDTVFMYVAQPVSAILYKCIVTQTDIPYKKKHEELRIKNLMRIKLLKRYDPARFTFEVLGSEYGIFAVRGPRGIPDSLSRDLA